MGGLFPREDPRFTYGLVHDVFTDLEKHGYRWPFDDNEINQATSASIVALLHLKIYCDNDCGASNYSRKARPAYEEMLRDAAKGRFKVILAYSNSRFDSPQFGAGRHCRPASDVRH